MKSSIRVGTKWTDRGTNITAELVAIGEDGKVQLAVPGKEGYRVMSKSSLFSNYKPAPAGDSAGPDVSDKPAAGPLPLSKRFREKTSEPKPAAALSRVVRLGIKAMTAPTKAENAIASFELARELLPGFGSAETLKQGQSIITEVLGGDTGKDIPAAGSVPDTRTKEEKAAAADNWPARTIRTRKPPAEISREPVFENALIIGTGNPPAKVQTCRVCGCTDLKGCLIEGDTAKNEDIMSICSWVEKDLCSACVKRAKDSDMAAAAALVSLQAPPVTCMSTITSLPAPTTYRGYEVGDDEETEGKKDGVHAIEELEHQAAGEQVSASYNPQEDGRATGVDTGTNRNKPGDTGKKPRAAVGRVKLSDGTIITGADFITKTCGCVRAETYKVDSPIRWLLKPAGQEMLKVRGAAIVYGEQVSK